jgi:hypothetical protein
VFRCIRKETAKRDLPIRPCLCIEWWWWWWYALITGRVVCGNAVDLYYETFCFQFPNCQYRKCRGLPEYPRSRTVVLSINKLGYHFRNVVMSIFNNNASRICVIAVFLITFSIFRSGTSVVKVKSLGSFREFTPARLRGVIIPKSTIWILAALRIFNIKRLRHMCLMQC